jgi:RimJ/RimL family protein N-acetyltransferase
MNIFCLHNIPTKLRRNIRDYGFFISFKKILGGMLSPIFETRTYFIYVADLQKTVSDQQPANRDVRFRFVGPGEEKIIEQIEDMEDWLRGKVAAKLRKGQRCLVALHGNDTVAGFNLIGFTNFTIPGIALEKPLRAFECFSEQITIHPDFRKKGLGTDLRHAVFREMKTMGYRRLYGGTHVYNVPNKALTRKVGFRIFARVRYRNLCGVRRLFISRGK